MVVILVVPTAFAAIYMWALWDPTNYLHTIPVAVANDDQGGYSDGKYENVGDEVYKGLTSSGQLDFHKVSSKEAVTGLDQGRYAFSLVIPADFSRRVFSVTDDHPKQAKINVYYNDFNGILVGATGNGVVAQAQQQVQQSISKSYASEVLVGLNQLGSGFTQAAAGSGQLKDGTKQLLDGSGQLDDGIGQVADGVNQLKTGSGQLYAGTSQLSTGTGQLVGGTKQLGDGAVQIRDGVGQILTPLLQQLTPVANQAKQITPLLGQLERSPDPTVRDAAKQLAELVAEVDATNPDGVVSQLTQLRDGTAELARQLTDPHADYLSGVLQVNDGAKQLNDGARQLDDGLGQLQQGIPALQDGSRQLHDGIKQVDDGTGQLDGGLKDGAKQAPRVNDVNASADQFASPATLDVTNQEPSQIQTDPNDLTKKKISKGAGPVIVVIGTYFLVFLLWTLLTPMMLGATGSARRRALVGTGKATVVGAVAGIVFGWSLSAVGAAVGWDPGSWPVMLGIVAVVGVAASLTTQVVTLLFGRVFGPLIAFVLFMFGMFVYGGIWPPGTTPGPMEPLTDFSPMTYSQRAIVRGHIQLYDNEFMVAVVMLVVFIIASTAVGYVVRYGKAVGAEASSDDDREPVDTSVHRRRFGETFAARG